MAALTKFFHTPCMMLDIEGAVAWYTDEAEIVEFNKSRRDAFQAGGATRATLRGVDVLSLGPHAAQALTNWELLRSDGSVERAWRHYYTLGNGSGEWKILLSAFQTGS